MIHRKDFKHLLYFRVIDTLLAFFLLFFPRFFFAAARVPKIFVTKNKKREKNEMRKNEKAACVTCCLCRPVMCTAKLLQHTTNMYKMCFYFLLSQWKGNGFGRGSAATARKSTSSARARINQTVSFKFIIQMFLNWFYRCYKSLEWWYSPFFFSFIYFIFIPTIYVYCSLYRLYWRRRRRRRCCVRGNI